jgi:hypothetical protein
MIHKVTRQEFLDVFYNDTARFMASIDRFEAYVVKRFYERERILAFRRFLLGVAAASEPSWHPCFDGVPDYHRINDEYPKSWVKARMHSFYFHRWNAHRDLFAGFKEIFEMKNFLGRADKDSYYDTVPSHGVISRIVSHQYPRGGGYLAEHIDPASNFALIQTIVQASDYGEDFTSGGLYIRPSPESEPVLIDPHTEMGDLVVASPAVRHGVLPIDPSRELDWRRTDGRWMILPVVIRSDYQADPGTKPRMVDKAA